MTNSLHTDTYYRGYRLARLREGTPTETINIYHEADFLGCCPTLEQAKSIVDSYHNAP